MVIHFSRKLILIDSEPGNLNSKS